jgi:hypothetical protein
MSQCHFRKNPQYTIYMLRWIQLWRGISSIIPYMTLCLTLVLEDLSDKFIRQLDSTLPISNTYVCLVVLEKFTLQITPRP